jgi:hypothetical protein
MIQTINKKLKRFDHEEIIPGPHIQSAYQKSLKEKEDKNFILKMLETSHSF